MERRGSSVPCRRARRGMLLAILGVSALGTTAHADSAGDTHDGDATRGASVYQVCMGCHSIDDDDVGPRHRGVVGRTAGTVPGFAYSPALKGSHIVWDRATLDRWLTNPQALVPGTRMFFAM